MEPHLCARCKQLGLSQLFLTPRPTLADIEQLDWLPPNVLLTESAASANLGCTLCAELSSRFLNRHAEYQLCALPPPLEPDSEISRILKDKVLWLQAIRPTDCAGKKLGKLSDMGIDQYYGIGWTAIYRTSDAPELLYPRPVSKQWNPSLVKSWLDSCRRFHSEKCNTPTISHISAPDLLLIDCETLQLCRPSERVPYTALSYVWVKATPDAKTKGQPETSTRSGLPEELPSSIKDTISVTKQREIRYLWVDKYCIDQEDPLIRSQQIENMDRIYMSAELTIIAAAGVDERHGLAGVGPERRVFSTQVDDVTITYVPMEPFRPAADSEWRKRAWTYQEEFLSRRRLYFLEEEIVFVCHGTKCREAHIGVELATDANSNDTYSQGSRDLLPWFAVPDREVWNARTVSSSPGEELTPIQREIYQKVWRVISDYAFRDLTYDSDTLRALAGIRKVFETRAPWIHHVQGLPVVVSESGSQLFATSLVRSLCWEDHTNPQARQARRKTHFPSWTWAGWQGLLGFPFRLERSLGGETHTRLISVEYPGGICLTPKTLHDALVARLPQVSNVITHKSQNGSRRSGTDVDANLPTILHLHAAIIPFEHLSLSNDGYSKMTVADLTLFYYSTYPTIARGVGVWSNDLQGDTATGTNAVILLCIDEAPPYRPELQAGDRKSARLHLLLTETLEGGKVSRIGKLTATTIDDENLSVADVEDRIKGILRWEDISLA